MAKYTNSFRGEIGYIRSESRNLIDMRKIVLLMYLVSLSSLVFGQRILPQIWFNENNISDKSIQIGDASMLYGLNSHSSDLEGDYFWNQVFQKANVYFYPQELKMISGGIVKLDSLLGVGLRLDLWNDRVEFKSPSGIKVIDAEKVSHILIQESEGSISQFINPEEFQFEAMKGLLMVLGVGGKRVILQSKEVLVQRPDYNSALDTGSKEFKIVKKNHFHYWNGNQILNIDNKKNVANLLESLGLDAKKYLKNSKNKLKSDEDFKDLAHFIFESHS
ncbi:MAG: hypothetical protein ACI9DJ_002723 [Algoriphagus sp.]|jgi:hypothetical protein